MFLLVVVMVKRSKSGSKYHKCLKGGSLLGVVGAAVLAVGWAHKSVVVWWFLVDGRAGFKFLCFPW